MRVDGKNVQLPKVEDFRNITLLELGQLWKLDGPKHIHGHKKRGL